MDMTRDYPLCVGLVGVGYWGPNLLRTLMNNPEVRLKTVVDVSTERREYVISLHPNIQVVDKLDILLSDPEIEAVVIATPVHTHFKLAKCCLEAGKHILVEKPLTSTMNEGLELKKISENHQKLIMVGHTFLYNNAVRYVKDYIDSGECGDIRYIHSQRLNLGRIRNDVDALWNFAPHDLSIIQYWMNNILPIEIHRNGMAFIQKDIEDISFLSLTYPDNKFANIHVSWLNPLKVREIIVVGSKKMIVYDDVAKYKVKIYDKNIDIRANLGEYMDFDQKDDNFFIHRSGSIETPDIVWEEPLKQEIQHFVDCIKRKVCCLTGIDHALQIVGILSQASIKNV